MPRAFPEEQADGHSAGAAEQQEPCLVHGHLEAVGDGVLRGGQAWRRPRGTLQLGWECVGVALLSWGIPLWPWAGRSLNHPAVTFLISKLGPVTSMTSGGPEVPTPIPLVLLVWFLTTSFPGTQWVPNIYSVAFVFMALESMWTLSLQRIGILYSIFRCACPKPNNAVGVLIRQ